MEGIAKASGRIIALRPAHKTVEILMSAKAGGSADLRAARAPTATLSTEEIVAHSTGPLRRRLFHFRVGNERETGERAGDV